MPKRVLDFDALWSSDKLAACAPWAQAEYAWLYGLADCNGSFELTNLRVIWGRVAAIRHALTLERLEQIFAEFIAQGLLFTWESGGKRYGHWTGSDQPGRLPPPSWRARLERLAPAVPKVELAAFMARFSQSKIPQREVTRESYFAAPQNTRDVRQTSSYSLCPTSPNCSQDLKLGSSHSLEVTPAQDLDLDKGREEEMEWELVPISNSSLSAEKESSPVLSHTKEGKAADASASFQTEARNAAVTARGDSHSAVMPRCGTRSDLDVGPARPRHGISGTAQVPFEQPRPSTQRYAPNRSPLSAARVGTGPVLTTGRVRREALERIVRREAVRRTIPP
jgi:hypothetical protein